MSRTPTSPGISPSRPCILVQWVLAWHKFCTCMPFYCKLSKKWAWETFLIFQDKLIGHIFCCNLGKETNHSNRMLSKDLLYSHHWIISLILAITRFVLINFWSVSIIDSSSLYFIIHKHILLGMFCLVFANVERIYYGYSNLGIPHSVCSTPTFRSLQ